MFDYQMQKTALNVFQYRVRMDNFFGNQIKAGYFWRITKIRVVATGYLTVRGSS